MEAPPDDEFAIDPDKACEIAAALTEYAHRNKYAVTDFAAACHVILRELAEQGVEIELLEYDTQIH